MGGIKVKGKNKDKDNQEFSSLNDDKQRELISKGNMPKSRNPNGSKTDRLGSSKGHK
jgi:hypothetical protein